jgi:hypothetical protein
MDRTELTAVLMAALFGAVLTGWVLHAVYARINRTAGPRSIRQTALLVEQLHACEDAREKIEARCRAAEQDFVQRVSEMQAELEAAHASIEAARDETEEIRAAHRAAQGRAARNTSA